MCAPTLRPFAHSTVAPAGVVWRLQNRRDGVARHARQDEPLVDVITRVGGAIPHVCYHPQLGSIQTCDTCMVDVNGQLVRACATGAADGMVVRTASAKAGAAQVEAFDR